MNLEVIYLNDIPIDILRLILGYLQHSRDILHFGEVCRKYYNYVNRILQQPMYLRSWISRFSPIHSIADHRTFEQLVISYIFESLDIYFNVSSTVRHCVEIYRNINVLELVGSLKFQNLSATSNVLVYLECNNQHQAKIYWRQVCHQVPLASSFYIKVAEVCVRKNLYGFAEFGIDNLNYNLWTEAVRQGNLEFYRKKFLKPQLLFIQIAGDLATTPSTELFETECISQRSRILENISPNSVLIEVIKQLILVDDVARLQKILSAKRYKKQTYKYILNTLRYCTPKSMCLPILIDYFRPVYISHISKIIDILVEIGAANYIKLLPLPIHIC